MPDSPSSDGDVWCQVPLRASLCAPLLHVVPAAQRPRKSVQNRKSSCYSLGQNSPRARHLTQNEIQSQSRVLATRPHVTCARTSVFKALLPLSSPCSATCPVTGPLGGQAHTSEGLCTCPLCPESCPLPSGLRSAAPPLAGSPRLLPSPLWLLSHLTSCMCEIWVLPGAGCVVSLPGPAGAWLLDGSAAPMECVCKCTFCVQMCVRVSVRLCGGQPVSCRDHCLGAARPAS